jgi:hypothetical protein
MYVSQRLKAYEHVGKAHNQQRQRSDERQMTPYHNHNKDQRTKKSHFSKITKHEGTKTKDYSTTTQKVQDNKDRRPNHVEHHSNDHPLGGDC